MKTKLVALLLLAGSSMFAGSRFFFGVNVGTPYRYGYYVAPPPPPPVVYYAPPVSPGPDYTWVAGYYYPVGARYVWRPGYWARRPFAGAYWEAPRYHDRHYYSGYWRR